MPAPDCSSWPQWTSANRWRSRRRPSTGTSATRRCDWRSASPRSASGSKRCKRRVSGRLRRNARSWLVRRRVRTAADTRAGASSCRRSSAEAERHVPPRRPATGGSRWAFGGGADRNGLAVHAIWPNGTVATGWVPGRLTPGTANAGRRRVVGGADLRQRRRVARDGLPPVTGGDVRCERHHERLPAGERHGRGAGFVQPHRTSGAGLNGFSTVSVSQPLTAQRRRRAQREAHHGISLPPGRPKGGLLPLWGSERSERGGRPALPPGRPNGGLLPRVGAANPVSVGVVI